MPGTAASHRPFPTARRQPHSLGSKNRSASGAGGYRRGKQPHPETTRPVPGRCLGSQRPPPDALRPSSIYNISRSWGNEGDTHFDEFWEVACWSATPEFRARSRISPCSSMRLRTAGCNRVFEEKASGAQRERPALKAALEYMRQGDTLVVWRLDRLARSLKQLIETVEGFGARNVGLRPLTEAIDTTTAGGKLVFHIFAALAEFERGIIRERTLAGLQAARARGRTGGRPPALKAKDLAAAKALLLRTRDHRGPGRQAPGCGGLDLLPAICRGRGPRPWKPEPEPAHADQVGAALLLPDRLAADQPLGPVRAGRWQVSGLRATARRDRSAIWATAAGGTRRSRPGVTAEGARSPSLPWPRMRRSARPRSCSPPRTSTTTPCTVAAGIATSGRSANDAIFSTTGRSIGGAFA